MCPSCDASQEESHPSKNVDSKDEEEHTDQPQPLASKTGWKHSTYHPLENLMSPLNSRMQIRSKIRNLVALSAFISTIEIIKCERSIEGCWMDQLNKIWTLSVWVEQGMVTVPMTYWQNHHRD